MKTFIVNKTMPTFVTVSYEVEAETGKEAYESLSRVIIITIQWVV